jgi:hypothetical protein
MKRELRVRLRFPTPQAMLADLAPRPAATQMKLAL